MTAKQMLALKDKMEAVLRAAALEAEQEADALDYLKSDDDAVALYKTYRTYFNMSPAQARDTVLDIASGRKSVDYLPTGE